MYPSPIGRTLVIVDLIWFLAWFITSICFIAIHDIENDFRNNLRGLLAHSLNTGGLLYILRKTGSFSLGPGIPFLLALFADIEVGLTVIMNSPPTHSEARIVSIIMAWIGVALTLCGIIYFFARKFSSAPAKKRGALLLEPK